MMHESQRDGLRLSAHRAALEGSEHHLPLVLGIAVGRIADPGRVHTVDDQIAFAQGKHLGLPTQTVASEIAAVAQGEAVVGIERAEKKLTASIRIEHPTQFI